MRVFGAIALVIGFLLCVSIAWAAIGFFAMGFGLIFLLIAEERKKASALRSKNSEIERSPAGPPQPIAATTSSIRQEVALREMGKWSEMDKWTCLVANDEDLSRILKILEPFGQKYVDQLAGAYIVFDNKAYLPTILNLIVASARKDAGLSATNIRKFPSAAEADMSFASGMQQEALDEELEKNAIVEDLIDATVRPSATPPVPPRKGTR
jgi:hypothetical protein